MPTSYRRRFTHVSINAQRTFTVRLQQRPPGERGVGAMVWLGDMDNKASNIGAGARLASSYRPRSPALRVARRPPSIRPDAGR